MANIDKYDKVFIEVFSVSQGELGTGFSFSNISAWDSVAHMELIASLEDAFGIMFDTEDILAFSSYEEGKALLAKYDVLMNDEGER